jgi:uncharacterized protein YukE
MRSLAGTLRGHAARAAAIGESVGSTLAALVFEGPAAGPFRERQRDAASAFRTSAEELQALAGLLESSATEVEAAQRERERRLAEMWAEYRAQHEMLPGRAI